MFDKQKSIEGKNKIQEIAVKASYKHKNIALTWATGCGKSLGSLKICKEHFQNKDVKGYLVCKETAHLDNWEADIKEHNMDFIDDITEKFLYASLHKYEDKGTVDFIILDECHAITPNRLEKLAKIIDSNTRIILLSATLEDNKKYELGRIFGNIGEYHISISDAIKYGILPHPKVFIHYFELDDENAVNSITYKQYGKEITIGGLTQKEAYERYSILMDEYREIYEKEFKQWAQNLWVNTGSKRKRMMAEFKTHLAFEIIEKYMIGKRRIVFTGSKEQAEAISLNYVHSGRSSKYNKAIKDNFNNFKINDLAVVNMFREAINLVKIEKGLIIQLDNVKLSFIQMLGRVFRSDIPEMHIIIFKDTQDEKYLKTVLDDFNMEYVTEINHLKHEV